MVRYMVSPVCIIRISSAAPRSAGAGMWVNYGDVPLKIPDGNIVLPHDFIITTSKLTGDNHEQNRM